MNVFQAGGAVKILRFLPDGRRLLAGVTVPAPSGRRAVVPDRFVILPVAGGDPVALDLPQLLGPGCAPDAHGNQVAAHPDGERVFIAWGGQLYVCRADDGRQLPAPADAGGHQVAVSPDGRRVLVADLTDGQKRVTCLTDDLSIDWVHPLADATRYLAGFAADGDAVVTVGSGAQVFRSAGDPGGPTVVIDGSEVRVWSARDPGGPAATTWTPPGWFPRPAVSPDGRYLGMVGNSNFYLCDLLALRYSGRLLPYRTVMKVADWAFHPSGRFLAAILNAPTLVKLYDVETLKPAGKLNWKLGPLNAVAFSPDGTLGAAGSDDGRIVVWDVDA